MGWACRRIRSGDTVTVRPQRSHLGYYAIRDADFGVPAPDGLGVVLDLRAVEFIWPFGLVFLEWYLRDLLARGAESVGVHVPSLDVGNYLVRMHLLSAFEDEDRVSFDVPLDQLRETDQRDALVELERFEVAHDDAVEELGLRLVRIVVEKLGDQASFEPLFLTISEVLSNIEVHSGANGGTVAVQRYSDRVCIAFGDAGVGIPAKLSSHFPDESDSRIIAKALEPEVSSRPGGGGLGLTHLADLVSEREGHMTIHSASGQVEVTRSGVDRREGCCPVQGTLVEVGL